MSPESSRAELLDVVDEDDRVVGQAPRGEIYAQGLRHRTVFVLVRDGRERIFVHQRAADKLVYPSHYDMFVGGVVGAGEAYDSAAWREASEELGVELPAPAYQFRFRYDGADYRTWSAVYELWCDGEVDPPADEIAWHAFLPESQLRARLAEWPWPPDSLAAYQRRPVLVGPVARAGRSDGDDFEQRTRPYRPELLAHSYRMLASLHDAEDAVQETYLRAWHGYDAFEGRSSIRTWLYRIATNTCLRALENRGRRALPTGLGGPGQDPGADLSVSPEIPWVEPIPDSMFGGSTVGTDDPLATVTQRESVRLAFIAALQHLSPRQRAVLVLREVLTFSAAEVATMLDSTPAAVNSLLQRARAQLDRAQLDERRIAEPHPPEQRELLDRYVAAMHANDIEGLISTLTADAIFEMPPFPTWFEGARTIGEMVAAQSPAQRPGDHLLVPTAANGQPAFGLYLPDEHGIHRAFNLQVLTLTPAGISHIVAFFDLRLFARFGLPDTAPPG